MFEYHLDLFPANLDAVSYEQDERFDPGWENS